MRRILLFALAACAHPHPSTLEGVALSITTAPELVAPGVISTESSEVKLATSPDGQLALWGSTNRPGGPGGWNIWMARRSGDGWGTPAPAPFDSDANDFDPSISPDGKSVYFFSNRPGGAGGDDLYRAAILPGGFGPAEHLGPEVNTPGDEWAPVLSPDGKTLLFASNVPGARHDLYLARVQGTGFAKATPLPGAVNTADDEFDGAFLADGTSIVFARSTDVESAPIQLYFSTRERGAYTPAQPVGVNVPGGYTLGPSIDGADPHVLYFSSVRATPTAGKLDLYRVLYAL